MAANQFMKYAIGCRVKSDLWWAYVIVAFRVALLVLALSLALQESVACIGLLAGILIILWVMRVVVRITLHDMADPNWEPQCLPRFIGLVFVNLLEVLIASAVLVAATESIESGRSFSRPIETFGDALMFAAAPFGGSGTSAETGWAQLTSLTGLVLFLFMTIVVIAAAVNGAYAIRNKPPTPDGSASSQGNDMCGPSQEC